MGLEDVKLGLRDLYEFLVNYEYLSKAQEIKSNIYQEAIKFMKKEVREGQQ